MIEGIITTMEVVKLEILGIWCQTPKTILNPGKRRILRLWRVFDLIPSNYITCKPLLKS